ncbi:hypothetical protein QBC98_007621 [Kitasatospora acidiphila]
MIKKIILLWLSKVVHKVGFFHRFQFPPAGALGMRQHRQWPGILRGAEKREKWEDLR